VPPLGLLVIGLVLVMVDLNVNTIDLVPDLIGWPVALVGLSNLSDRTPWFRVAMASAVLGLAVSVLDLVGGTGSLVFLLDAVSGTGVAFGTCTAIIRLVHAPEVRHTANLIRWWHLGLIVVSTVLVSLVGEDLGVLAIVLVVLFLAVVVWFLAFCWKQRNRPELTTAPAHGG
jgi:hypothetical protein